MQAPRQARFRGRPGGRGRQELYNDGSLPQAAEGILLVASGGPGEVVQVGHHAEADLPVYVVDFGVAVLGCLEEELLPAGFAPGPAP